jgi:hypothetical protein
MPSEPTRQPKLTLHKNGHVTLSGINYRDLFSLLTIASLYAYDDKPEYDNPDESIMPSIVRRNNAETEMYHRERRLLLDYLSKLESQAIARSNKRDEYVLPFKEFRKQENEYWFPAWCDNPDNPGNNPGTPRNLAWREPARKRNAAPAWPE